MKDKKNSPKCPNLRFPEFEGEWEEKMLGEVIEEFYNGQTPSRLEENYWNGPIRWLTSGELNYNTIYDTAETITEKGLRSSSLRIVPKGTFIIAITGLEAAGTRGSCATLGIDCAMNQSCMALVPKPTITNHFLKQWYLKNGESYGIKYTQGTKQQSYNKSLLEILPIPLPPSIEEQNKITALLELLDQRIDTQIKIIEELERLKNTLINQQTTDKLLKKELSLSSCVQIKSGYSGAQLDNNKEGCKVTRIETISNSDINLGRVGYVNAEKSLIKYKLNIGDILFSNINSPSHIGKTAYIDCDYDLFHGMNLLRLIPDTSILDPYYLYLVLNSNKSKYRFQAICNRAVSQASINQTELGKLKIKLPSITHQRTVSNFMQNVDKSIKCAKIQLQLYNQQKQYLLQNLFM